MVKLLGSGVVGLILFSELGALGIARANPEPTATYDARIAGLGGAGAATADSAAALFHNPARLDQIERFSMTVVMQSLLVNLRAPFAGPGSERDSGILFAPLFFAGGAGRVHEKVVVGLGAYVYTGFGGGFTEVECIGYGSADNCQDPDFIDSFGEPQDQNVTLLIAELSVPIQVSLAPNLSVGVTLRIPYGFQQVVANTELGEPPGIWALGEQTLSGFGIPGVLLGLTYSPIQRADHELTLALAYRSKVWVNLSGTTSSEIPFVGEIEIDTTSRWYVPHMVRAGLAYRTWNNRFMVTGEFRVQFHDEANNEQRFELAEDGVPTTVAQFDWRNVFTGVIAAELYVHPRVPIRLAFSTGRSASNPDTLTPFSPPFGVQFGVYGGAGVKAGPIDVDVNFGWGGGPAATIDDNGPLCVPAASRPGSSGSDTLVASGGCAGSYDVDSWFLGLSATYHLGRTDAEVARGP